MMARATVEFLRSTRTRRLPPEKVKRLQGKKLRRMMRFVYDGVPYYRRVLEGMHKAPEDFTSTEALRDLPILRKTELAQNAELLHGAGVRAAGSRSSTGTTGPPVMVLWSAEQYAVALALHLRQVTVAGARPWTKVVTVWPPTSTWRKVASSDGSARPTTIIQELPGARYYGLLAPRFVHLWSDTSNPLRDAEALARMDPEFIICTPSRLRRIGRVGGGAVERIRPKRVFVANELMTEATRAFVEGAFHTKVLNGYGASEFGPLGWECPEQRGIHAHEDYIIYEVLKDGEAVGPGESGELTLTTLHNTAMPLLRYATGDIVRRADDDECECGSSMMRLSAVCGRYADGLIARDGSRVLPLDAAEVVEETIGPADYQLVQKETDAIELRLHSREMVDATAVDRLRSGLAQLLGVTPRMDVVEAGDEDFVRKNRSIICQVSPGRR